MPDAPYLQKRVASYYYRQKVPVQLQSVYGQSEVVLSLKTTCRRVARKRGLALFVEIDRSFQEVRELLGEVDHTTARMIAERWKRRTLNQDFEERLNGQRQSADSPQEIGRLYRDLHRMDFTTRVPWVSEVARDMQIGLSPSSPDFNRFAYHLLKAKLEAEKEIQDREHRVNHLIDFLPEEEFVDPPSPRPAFPSAPHNEITLEAAFQAWQEETPRNKRTLQDWSHAVRRFVELTGPVPVSRLTKAHFREFKTLCLKMPTPVPANDRRKTIREIVEAYQHKDCRRLNPVTVNKMLTALKSILSWCVSNGYLQENPASGISVPAQRQKRHPFSDEDLKAIFGSPVFTARLRPRAGAGEAAYWIPVLGLYTGARLEELGQLHLSDVRREGDIVYLDINAEGEGKRLKTKTSERRVPIHADVLRAGFGDYLKEIKERKFVHLFPRLNHTDEKCTSAFSKWVNRYLRQECGITDKRKVFHSFRHTFKDACRNAGIPRDVHDALTGHSDGSVGSSYGNGFSIQVLDEWTQKINFPDLTIPPARR